MMSTLGLLIADDQNFKDRIELFKSLPLEEASGVQKNGDKLFEGFKVGNEKYKIDRPYERLHDYEKLLSDLKNIDEIKFNNLHKGTPFYFLAWLSFDFKSYNKALFYIDAAVSEDQIHRPNLWHHAAAIQFYYLSDQHQVAKRTINKIKEVIEEQCKRFNTISSNSINLEQFIKGFVKSIMNDNNKTERSLIGATYIFLLEFEELYQMLELRTSHGGTILPFVSHLFTGGLIFESLLKRFYPTSGNTLGKILKSTNFKNDFNSISITPSASNLNDILKDISKINDPIKLAFQTTSNLRNTTGHKITWDDIFDNPENYKKLFEQEVNAIFHLIVKKCIPI